MRKQFLLLLWLTLLPLVGWAQTNPTSKSGLEYKGFAQDLVNAGTGASGGNSFWYAVVTDGSTPPNRSSASTTVPSRTNAGDYDVYWAYGAASGMNPNQPSTTTWNGAQKLDVSIAKIQNSITGLAIEGWTEGEAAKTPTYTSVTYGTPTWQYSNDGGTSWSASVPTTGGQWLVRAFIATSTNYLEFTSDGVEFTILKKAPISGISLQGQTYNDGEPVSLISGTPSYPADYDTSHGGIEYIVKTDAATPAPSETGTAAAEETDVNTYYVFARIKADGDLYATGDWTKIGSTGVKINKAPFKMEAVGFTAPTPLATVATYTAAPQKLFVDGVAPTGGTIFYGLTTGNTIYGADATEVKVENVADATKLYYKVSESDNYLESDELSIDLAMNLADLTVKNGTAYNAPYDTYEHFLIDAEPTFEFNGSPVSGTLTYGFDGNTGLAYNEVKATNKGDYPITFTFEATNFNKLENNTFGTAQITTATNAIDAAWTVADVIYPADPVIATPQDAFGNDATLTFTKNGEDIAQPAAGEWTAGDWTVTASVEAPANENYTAATKTLTFTIAQPTLNLGLTPKTLTYGDAITLDDIFTQVITSDEWVLSETSAQKLAVLNEGLNVTVTKDGEASTFDAIIAAGADAGVYTIALAKKSDPTPGNYNIKLYSNSTTITIEPKDLLDTDFDLAATAVYSGNDETPTVTTALTDADYDLVMTNSVPAEVTTMVDVDTYTFTFTGKGNYQGEITKTFEITKATAEITGLDITGWEYGSYDEAVNKPTATTNFGEITYTYAVKGSTEFSAEVPTNFGEYTVKASVAGTDNWDAAVDVTKDFTITKAPLTLKAADDSKVYGDDDPAEFALVADPAPAYKNGDDAAAIGLTIVRAEGENVGEYAITPAATSTNYEYTIVPGTFEITAAELTIAVDDKEKTFEDADPEFTAVLTGLTHGDKAEDMGLTFSRESGEDVGEYAITAEATKASNYTVTVEDGVLTINQQPVTPTAPKALALTYNGLDQALVVAGEAKGSTVKYAITAIDGTPVDGALAENIPEAKNAATYTVSYEFTPGGNFSIADDLAAGTVDVKINKAHVSYRMGNQTEDYTGEAFAPVEGQAYQLVDGDLMVGDEDAFTFDWVEGFDATTAAEEGRVFTELVATFKDGIENYTIQCVQEGKLYIKKADLKEGVHYTAPKAKEDLVYDPTGELNPQELVTPGSVVEVDEKPLGTIMFSNDKAGEYSAEIPTGIEASGYTVWFYVAGDENHNDTEPVQIEGVAIGAYALTDNMLPEEYQEGAIVESNYTAEVQNFNIPLTGLVEGTDYEVELDAEEIKDAGLYTFTFTGIGNYTGELTAQVNIKKLELIATAPNAKKTYDGTNKVEEGEFGAFEFNGLLKGDKIDLGDLTVADVISVPADAINVGTYELAVSLSDFPEQKNYVINAADILPGTLTIDPAAPVTIGFKEGVTYSKSYATEDNLAVIADDLTATAGELFVEPAEFAQLLKISREPGEVYKEDGYTVSLDFENQESLLEAIAKFKKNYEGVSFGTTKFFITPFAGNIKVSIASASSVYDGTVPTYGWDTEEDTYLSNMVVTGIDADKKAEIFSKLPTVTISGITADAGDYNIELAKDFESVNFDPEKITLVLGSYYTIEQFDLANAEVTIPKQQAKVGDKAEEVIDATAFTIKGLPVEADAAGFAVAAADDFVQKTDNVLYIVEGEDYTKGLVLVSADDDITKNYTGWENGEITGNLIVEGGEELVLDDSGAITTTSSGDKTVKVTFTSRTINPGTWNVLVLPFDVTPAQVSNAFGYAVVDVLNKEKNSKGDIHFMINTTETVPAGKPFIVKPGKDLAENEKENFTEITFTGVKVKAFDDNTEDVDDNGNKFIGTFKDTQIGGLQYRYMSKGMWYDARNFESKPLTIKPLRAFIEMAPENVNARIFIEEADGTVTAIDGVTFNNELNEGMYNLNGMKVNNLNRKGVFIQNGKKVIK